MPDPMVEQVRRFNRVVTERVGAFSDRFLGRPRPLAEARLLGEIGLGGCEVRLLRSGLRLDSGYLSGLVDGSRQNPACAYAGLAREPEPVEGARR
jgi:hypothetical protein